MPDLGIIGEAAGNIGIKAPSMNIPLIFLIVAWILGIILIAGITGIIAWNIIQKKKYNLKIPIMRKINGRIENVMVDKAKRVKLGKTATFVIHLKKLNRILPDPRLQSGRNEFTHYERESDGELINISFEDIDERMRKEHVHFVKLDMRYAHTSMAKMIKELYDDENWLKKHATMLIGIAFFLIMAIIALLWFGKTVEMSNVQIKIADTQVESTRQMNIMMDKMATIMNQLNIMKSGSGIVTQ